MSRKVYVEVKVKLILVIDEGVDVDGILNEMDYNFTYPGNDADIVDTELLDYEITDSK